MTKTAEDGTVAEWHKYVYNDSNQLVSEELYDGKKTTKLNYEYDADGNRISEVGKIGTDKVEKYYEYDVENRLAAVYDADELLMAAAYDGDGNRVFQLNYNLHTDNDWKGNSGNGNGNNKDNKGSGNNGKGSSNNGKGNSKSEGTDDAGYGNATNAEENNSQNQSGILFPIDSEVSDTEQSLIDKIKTTGKHKNYELIEYINDVNREYTEVLVEQNINGKTDTSYIYGVDRLSLDRFDGSTGYYLYDPRGSVAGITNEEGQIYQSYRYSVNGEITFGAPQYENEYTYNGESYNPNVESQYLRARYYDVVTANFLTEDSYLGNINEPLTLNRYNYCVSSPLNYVDPTGNKVSKEQQMVLDVLNNNAISIEDKAKEVALQIKAYRDEIARKKLLNAGIALFWEAPELFDSYITQMEIEASIASEVNDCENHDYKLSNKKYIWNYLSDNFGTSEIQTAAIMGNIWMESQFSPSNAQDHKYPGEDNSEYIELYEINDKIGWGLIQWTYFTRKEGLQQFAEEQGNSIADIEVQMEYLLYEVENVSPYNKRFQEFLKLEDIEEATVYFCEKIEEAGTPHISQRKKYAEVILKEYQEGEYD